MKKLIISIIAITLIPVSAFAYTGSWGFLSTSTPNYYPLSVFGTAPGVWADHFVATSTTATSTFPIASSSCFWNGTNCLVSGLNYWTQSGATTTNTVANVASTLGVFGSIQATSTTGTSTFAGAVGIGTNNPLSLLTITGNNTIANILTVSGGTGIVGVQGQGITLSTGAGAGSGSNGGLGGDFSVTTGSGSSGGGGSNGRGGNVSFTLGSGANFGPGAAQLGGSFSLVSGKGGDTSSPTIPANGGAVAFTAGNGGNDGSNGQPSGTGGTITFTAGNAGTVSSSTIAGGNGGNIIFIPGKATATGTPGYIGIGTTSPTNLLSVAGDGFFNGNITGTNLIATGTLTVSGKTTLANASTTNISASGFANVTGTTTTGGLSVGSLNGVLFGTNGAISAIATSSLGIPNYWTLSGATTTNTVANVASTLGVFGTIQATSTTGTSTFAGAVGIGTSSPIATLSVMGTSSSNINPFVVSSSSNAQMLTLLQNGNFGIGSTTPSTALVVVGTTTISSGSSYVGQAVCYLANGSLGHQTLAQLTAGTCVAN